MACVKAIPLTTLGAAAFVAAWRPINPLGLPESCFFIRIVNNSGVDLQVSFDGVTPHDFIPANGELNLPVQANNQLPTKDALFPKLTQVYVYSAAGAGVGEVTLSGYFV